MKRTCLSIFSKIGLIDQSSSCTEMYSQKITSFINLQKPIVILKKSNLSDIHHRKIDDRISIFSKIRLVDQSKPGSQTYLQKKCKLHIFAACN